MSLYSRQYALQFIMCDNILVVFRYTYNFIFCKKKKKSLQNKHAIHIDFKYTLIKIELMLLNNKYP